ncbi:1-(5-phosphoribosyl)-5-[(5-phosphoribosylamino)methylideneamino]imidazole-4-carboxamide isomerase [Candidatus Palibaumannia cicadellinicola]|uniref:1-(5-phosphoribosyl)-5-[(5-phosphoribosylamino)methylideneamino] imidazole-4-carboxamide isomerase n=1 Tax=Candidatus Palibaumannia cicadellinicola TaxID=186490 RepID=A0A0K2BLK8_9GAMM|nr:1-(5-phosphoribosyl)-5-[(5-phosphoribosylamino)methylideneamino]imidazole-4-carboxamide isomerase [Candidatus Baumannia cicadellinicola]AKZ65943.1 Phosphoribosylformimino-5-aminoimidazole carboxamide ribotide isomerase [Candidatus Baumannia cicadellinicola]
MIIPALDLIDGTVVRLYQGNYQQQNNYGKDPILHLHNYLSQGAELLHLVDLTGARDPSLRQIKLLTNLLSYCAPAKVQIGGGIRSAADVEELLKYGANRVVVGSTAVTQPQEVQNWFKIFGPDALVLALDVRIDISGKRWIAISGWMEDSGLMLEQVIDQYLQTVGLNHILCTDISRDGTLSGINIELYQSLCSHWPSIKFQSSGGICSLDDIAKLHHSGVHDVIIGRALLENKFTVAEAMACWQNV